jgi:multidrug efflux pump subunit AcrA (membrane-fusion protein)
MKILNRSIIWILFSALLVFSTGCNGKKAGKEGNVQQESEAENNQPASITLTPGAMTSADIKTTPAVMKVFRQPITAPGEIEFNARRLSHLTARTMGRIERIMAVAGDRVNKGQLLAEIYSPDYMAQQAEFLQAAERAGRFSGDQHEATTFRAFLESARERLLILGTTPAEITELQKNKVPRPFLPVRASLAGTIIETVLQPGDQVQLGSSLFRLADLAILWASLHIQEKDLAAIRTGSVLDAQTRTVIGRVEVPNLAGKLKTGMYIEAFLAGVEERTALVVPESAIQDNEGQPIVFVQTKERVFVKREIKTGDSFLGLVEILAGLVQGENVVTSGSFLLKSELNKSSLEE